MPDDLPTLWKAEPHTLAKHAILRKYLEAWMPILSHNAARHRDRPARILYVDGFAGPGEYTGGEPGSPLVALDTALNHSHDFPVPVSFLFIENRNDRFQHLKRVVSRYQEGIRSSDNVNSPETRCADCGLELTERLDAYAKAGESFGPALVFLDQFGYSAVPIELIGRIMRCQVCEVFSYFDWKDVNRFITDENKWPGLTRAFGGDEWRGAIEMSPEQRRAHLLEAYVTSLRKRAGVEYFCHFSMHDEHEQLLYWLFFCTGNLAGLQEMKNAMWSVDETGNFRFSDAEAPGQLMLLEGFDESWLAEKLSEHHRGKALPIREIERFVLVETPCYKYNGALGILEKGDRIDVLGAPAERRKGSFRKYEGDSRVMVRFK